MWIPKLVVDWFGVNAELTRNMQSELAVVRAERDILKVQLATSQTHFDWLRTRVNTLEYERAALMQKAYNINIPVPEIVHSTPPPDMALSEKALFEDIGDDLAKKLGFPTYNS